jgi:hypothetical protein
MADLVADDLLGMSDDDFLKLNDPSSLASEAAADTTPATEPAGTEAVTEGAEGGPTEAGAGEGTAAEPTKTTETPTTETAAKAEPEVQAGQEIPGSKPEGEASAAVPGEAATKSEAGAKTDAGASTYVAPTPEAAIDFHAKIMAPFRANGKTIELKTPEEVIALMQMGANYTRKMQDLQPHRKMITMLKNNDLLDEGKLSFLIDLERKNPEAIKKLVKDAGIDPMDIDVDAEPAYTAGNHQVTDNEVAFTSALEDLRSTPSGQETLTEINTTWDTASKEALWTTPELMGLIQQQRENGVYAEITAEIERRKTFGQIKPETSFLDAYKLVGDSIFGAPSGAGTMTQATQAGQPEPVVLATRPAAPKKAVEADEQASAAASSRGTATTTSDKKPNYLAMSDEEFLKLGPQFAGRV